MAPYILASAEWIFSVCVGCWRKHSSNSANCEGIGFFRHFQFELMLLGGLVGTKTSLARPSMEPFAV